MPFLPAAAAFVSANPWVIPAATSVASAAYRAITPDRQAELREGVLNSQLMFRDQLARHAFGDFTESDRQQIMDANEPQVNQIASGVARRGLGRQWRRRTGYRTGTATPLRCSTAAGFTGIARF